MYTIHFLSFSLALKKLLYLVLQFVKNVDMKPIETRITSMYVREDGILVLDIKPNQVFSKRDAEEVI